MAQPENIIIEGGAAGPMRGLLLVPDQASGHATVIHAATGVPHRFYRRFAAWLAETHGHYVLIYDYSGFGASARGKPSAQNVTIADWGIRDQNTALNWLFDRFPASAIHVVGHSLGGLFWGWHDKSTAVSSMVAVGSGPAHWRRHAWHFTPLALLAWFGPGPLAAACLGYAPGAVLGVKMDLPARVYWQFRRWCTKPGFYACDIGAGLIPPPDPARVTCPVTLVALCDDAMLPPDVVADTARYYPHSDSRLMTIRPQDYGLDRIGHIALFSEASRAAWPVLARALAREHTP